MFVPPPSYRSDVLPDGITFTATTHSAALTAQDHLVGLATERYARSNVAVDLELEVSADAELLGFAFTQFAMPVIARRDEPFDFAPAHNLRSPRCVLPLLVRDRGACILVAPLDNPHEQIITVEGSTIRWGWHGDLDEVPTGFTTTIGIYRGVSIRELFDQWAAAVLAMSAVSRRDRGDSVVTSHLSYWTDNGAAYWYRTEAGRTIAESVVDVIEHLDNDGTPVRSVELDSWFYNHATPRAIAEFGYPDEVPPTGAIDWLPRRDAFTTESTTDWTTESTTDWTTESTTDSTTDGPGVLQRRVGRPLTLHARHISPESPYVDDTWWVDDLAATPRDPAFFRTWFDDAVRWGATCIEQDWMLLCWFGVRDMRRVPGRAITWQRALNEHANATNIDLLWCMATPADLIAAAQFDRVIAVRTSDDYRFTADPALLWTWFLTVNRLVAPLGLWPFKDCFFSHPDPDPDDPISGDVHAEVEALLAAMSGGPVGIGDRIGRTDHDIVMRTCDGDGRLLQPTVPIGLIDDCLFGAPARGDRLAWSTASTTIDGETWTYVIALNTTSRAVTLTDTLGLAEVGIDGARHVYNWRDGNGASATDIACTLSPRDWALWVVCPPGSTDIGDPSKYVTVAAR